MTLYAPQWRRINSPPLCWIAHSWRGPECRRCGTLRQHRSMLDLWLGFSWVAALIVYAMLLAALFAAAVWLAYKFSVRF